jgi:hypothetical protein
MMGRRTLGMTATAALLYLGPLLAGLSLAPLAGLPVFAAVFLAWIYATRPIVPAGAAAMRLPAEAALHLGGVTLVQSLLVFVTFGLGRGFSGLLGGSLSMPLWIPFALSAAAVPLAFVFRSSWQDNGDGEALLDEACTEAGSSGHAY